MVGINEIIEKILSKKELTEVEKFKWLRSKKIDAEVIDYLAARLENLYIEVTGDYEGYLLELMNCGKLEGWCWQTTESAIVFFNDDDYIERGNLKFDKRTPKYYHSWICFKHHQKEYVLDPCLNLLCKKEDYSRLFETEVLGKVSARAVKEELIRQVSVPTKEEKEDEYSIIKRLLGNKYEAYLEKNKGEVVVHGPENVNTPLYRNGAGYRTEMENGKVKKLTVHYYITDA